MSIQYSGTSGDFLSDTIAYSAPYDMTLACRFNRQGATGSNQTLVSIQNDSAKLIMIGYNKTVTVGCFAATSQSFIGFRYADSSITVSNNTWDVCMGTFDSNTNREIYHSTAHVTDTQSGSYADSNNVLRVGQRDGTNFPADAKIHEVGVWSDDLDQQNYDTMNSGASMLFVRPDIMLAYYPFWNDAVLTGKYRNQEYIGGHILSVNGTAPSVIDECPRVWYPSWHQQLFAIAAADTISVDMWQRHGAIPVSYIMKKYGIQPY